MRLWIGFRIHWGIEMTSLDEVRKTMLPDLPPALRAITKLVPVEGEIVKVDSNVAPLFPHLKNAIVRFKEGNFKAEPLKVGVVLSGGQAAGGHNVICGLYRALKELNVASSLIGFLDGPKGIVENKYKTLDEAIIAKFLNSGGFDMIGSGRTKIETPEQFQKALEACKGLDGLVIIGGDDSNTNAALLAEYFLSKGSKTTVVGVPKTIDGDLANEYIEIPFGFDTACKVYSEMIGNILKDTLSAKKYWYFIKLMGRSASHITLECGYQTHPNLTLIAEEETPLNTLIERITTLIETRAKLGKNYGVILIPEGLIEFIPELKSLVSALNKTQDPASLPSDLKALFFSLPESIQKQLTLDRDPHGNIQVSKIDTERFLIELVKAKSNVDFSSQPLFFGYEGRSAFPSPFDSEYCYALGTLAALLIAHKATGTIAAIQNLKKPVSEWTIAGVPLISLMHIEERKGEKKPVIAKKLVDLNGSLYKRFKELEASWHDDYQSPGPIQYFGPQELVDRRTFTVSKGEFKR